MHTCKTFFVYSILLNLLELTEEHVDSLKQTYKNPDRFSFVFFCLELDYL